MPTGGAANDDSEPGAGRSGHADSSSVVDRRMSSVSLVDEVLDDGSPIAASSSAPPPPPDLRPLSTDTAMSVTAQVPLKPDRANDPQRTALAGRAASPRPGNAAATGRDRGRLDAP